MVILLDPHTFISSGDFLLVIFQLEVDFLLNSLKFDSLSVVLS